MSIVTGLDIGTTKIACLVGEVDERRRLRIVGVGIVPSRGIKKGMIVSVEEATAAIQEAVERAERSSGHELRDAYVGVAGSHISALNSRGTTPINRPSHAVEMDDVQRALEAARTIAIPHSQEIIHVVPRGYWLDGSNGVRDPVGLHGYRLEVEAHVVTAGATSLQTIEKCCQEADLSVRAFVMEPLASGEAVLSDDEKELGVVLVDIGGGTTDISIFLEGSVWHTTSLPIGGDHLTHDLAIGLQCPHSVAEEIKKRYGYASLAGLPEPDAPLEVAHFGDEPLRGRVRADVAEILHYRVEEIFDLVRREMKRSGYDGLLPAGLVLCGGSAQLAGIKEAGRAYFDLPVRVAMPQALSGMVDLLGSPAYATSVGLLEWGMHNEKALGRGAVRPKGRAAANGGWAGRLRRWFSTLLPG